MRRFLHLMLAAGLTSCVALAHFVFVVPDAKGGTARVFISETLEPDAEVGAKLVANAVLHLRDGGGKDTALPLQLGEAFHTVALPDGAGVRMIHGAADLGLRDNPRTKKPYVLIYHPKTILGNVLPSTSPIAGKTPVELIPGGQPGAVTLTLLADGKPLPNAEVTILIPGGSEKKVKTDASGKTEALVKPGRYGAWARYWVNSPGKRDGKDYDEIRHYATLVFDAPPPVSARNGASLPEATSSFGAVQSDGWLYVYGGHIAPTHSYSTEAVSGRFHRLSLSNTTTGWEPLPSGPGMQGMNLASYKGKIYRIGGMIPKNKPGEAADNQSTIESAVFDPGSRQWTHLPPLPEPRSSHDVVVIGNELFVVGGWALMGKDQKWMTTMLRMDLKSAKPEWKAVEQPFKRRALMAAAYEGKLYVLGGFDDRNRILREVTVFDPTSGKWSEAPKLPEGPGTAFAPAAVAHRGRLCASLSDGTVYCLNQTAAAWEPVGKATPRVAHRMASFGDSILVIGGADRGRNLDSLEAIVAQ